ncbi:MAG: ECF RNA polymerase sigma-E factor [Phycisphaerae bacterium]|nr:ECF RNA polymerase sigma-E factor [Phycisphaerae bacterium]
MNTAALSQTEVELGHISAIASGDRQRFDDFVRRHQTWVRGVVFGLLGQRDRVDDVCQRVWMNVWQQMPTLEQPQRWRGWLYQLVRNAALDAGRDATRQKRFRQQLAEQPLRQIRSTQPESDEQLRERIGRAIQGLPPIYREPFVLRHLEGWSYQTIAETLDLPVDTVETRLVRARRLLREALQGTIVTET